MWSANYRVVQVYKSAFWLVRWGVQNIFLKLNLLAVSVNGGKSAVLELLKFMGGKVHCGDLQIKIVVLLRETVPAILIFFYNYPMLVFKLTFLLTVSVVILGGPSIDAVLLQIAII